MISLFFTGDKGRYTADGVIEIHGRMDQQFTIVHFVDVGPGVDTDIDPIVVGALRDQTSIRTVTASATDLIRILPH